MRPSAPGELDTSPSLKPIFVTYNGKQKTYIQVFSALRPSIKISAGRFNSIHTTDNSLAGPRSLITAIQFPIFAPSNSRTTAGEIK